MEYSKDNTMTRKEYLKSKKKTNPWVSRLKYVLLIIVVILLGVYVFKQLNVYNNVTKLANKVVEETKLAKTMTMYYVSEPYTKDGNTSVMLYKSYDESRTQIIGSENLSNINIVANKLYGISDGQLCSIDLVTNEKTKLSSKGTENYIIDGENVYIKRQDGIYSYSVGSGKTKKIIDGKVYQMLLNGGNLYVITAGKTSKSIVKYNLSGKKDKELSDKYIVTSMELYGDNIYFVNSKDSKLYAVTKSGGKITNVLDSKISTTDNMICYKDYIYYINKSDNNMLYRYNIKTKKHEKVIRKNISSIQIDGDIIYYTTVGTIGINKLDIATGKTEYVTSARTSEYICIN